MPASEYVDDDDACLAMTLYQLKRPDEGFRVLHPRIEAGEYLLGWLAEADEMHRLLGGRPGTYSQPRAATTRDDDVKATLTLLLRDGDHPDFQQPMGVDLWVNDARLLAENQLAKWQLDGKAFRKVVMIPNAKLRTGKNVVTFQVYNRGGGRMEAVGTLQCTAPRRPRACLAYASASTTTPRARLSWTAAVS